MLIPCQELICIHYLKFPLVFLFFLLEEGKNIRKVFIDNLPRHINAPCKGSIDWKNTVGMVVKFIYDDIDGEIEIRDYFRINNRSKLIVKYNELEHTISTYSFFAAKLYFVVGRASKSFKYKVGDIISDENRKMIIAKVFHSKYGQYNKKCYSYKCLICGYENNLIPECNLTIGNACPCCANQITVSGINDIPTTAPWMVKFFQSGLIEAQIYTKCSNRKIYPICPDCQKVKSNPISISQIYLNHSIGCSCGDGKSYPHKFMCSVLDQLKIKYIEEYSPVWIGRKLYDIYIPEYKLILEMDGGLGHGKKIFSNKNTVSKIGIEESVKIDRHKDIKAKQHEIQVIRVDADKSNPDYLSKNIIHKLGTIFDLKDIDWSVCNIFATRNIVKEVCTFFTSNNLVTAIETANKLNMVMATVNKYLKKGNDLGWCNYDPSKSEKIRKAKCSNSNIKKFSKKVSVYNANNVFVKAYNSVSECERNSIEDFGVKLSGRNISLVATGKRKSHKGYKFEYINTN